MVFEWVREASGGAVGVLATCVMVFGRGRAQANEEQGERSEDKKGRSF